MKNTGKLIRKVIMIALSLSLLILSPSQDYVLQAQSPIAITTVKTAIPVPISTVADPPEH